MTDGLDLDERAEEEQHIVRLMRWVALFLMFPGFSIAIAFLISDDSSEHVGHITLSAAFGMVGLFLGLAARRIAVKYA